MRDFVTLALMKVRHSVVHKADIGEHKELGPLDKAIRKEVKEPQCNRVEKHVK